VNAFRAKTVETAEAGGAQVIDPRHVFRGLGLEAVLIDPRQCPGSAGHVIVGPAGGLLAGVAAAVDCPPRGRMPMVDL
jgi:hypothetical protein